MSKADIKKIIKRIKHHKEVIAKERDKIREILADLQDEVESFDDGVQLLDEAVGRLSEYV